MCREGDATKDQHHTNTNLQCSPTFPIEPCGGNRPCGASPPLRCCRARSNSQQRFFLPCECFPLSRTPFISKITANRSTAYLTFLLIKNVGAHRAPTPRDQPSAGPRPLAGQVHRAGHGNRAPLRAGKQTLLVKLDKNYAPQYHESRSRLTADSKTRLFTTLFASFGS